MRKSKSISILSLTSISVSAILVVDTIAAGARVGPSAVFWWILMFLFFFIPYGLITSELGAAYPQEGGIYTWVNRAFGGRWGMRTAWIYWFNFSIFIPSVFFLFAIVLDQLLPFNLSYVEVTLISIILSWVSCLAQLIDTERFVIIPIIGAVFKTLLILMLGVAGVYYGIEKGWATELNIKNMLVPELQDGLKFLPVIIFNFLGFEVISGVMKQIRTPQKDIPKSVLLGGWIVICCYIIGTLGIFASIPYHQISSSTGILKAFNLLFADYIIGEELLILAAVMLLYTMFAGIVTWGVGINRVIANAAQDGYLPKQLAKRGKRSNVPVNVAIWNGVISTAVMLIYFVYMSFNKGVHESAYNMMTTAMRKSSFVLSSSGEFFWDLLSLSAFFSLSSYLLMFPAFLKLRHKEPQRIRPYRVPGGRFIQTMVAYSPVILIVLSLVAQFYVPDLPFDATYFTRLGIAIVLIVLLGEFLLYRTSRKTMK